MTFALTSCEITDASNLVWPTMQLVVCDIVPCCTEGTLYVVIHLKDLVVHIPLSRHAIIPPIRWIHGRVIVLAFALNPITHELRRADRDRASFEFAVLPSVRGQALTHRERLAANLAGPDDLTCDQP